MLKYRGCYEEEKIGERRRRGRRRRGGGGAKQSNPLVIFPSYTTER
jgi:hypothetical protein